MMVAWSLPRTTGRVYGYLLMRQDPATLDEIANDLEVAKSGASVATRQLVSFGMARTHRQRGTKRLGFDAIYDLKGVIEARDVQTRIFLERLKEGSRVASSPAVRRKMVDMTDEMDDLLVSLRGVATRSTSRRRAG